MPFKVHQHSTFWGNNFALLCEPRSKKSAGTNKHGTIQVKERVVVIPTYPLYLSRFSQMTFEVFKPLWKLKSKKAGWAWNRMY